MKCHPIFIRAFLLNKKRCQVHSAFCFCFKKPYSNGVSTKRSIYALCSAEYRLTFVRKGIASGFRTTFIGSYLGGGPVPSLTPGTYLYAVRILHSLTASKVLMPFETALWSKHLMVSSSSSGLSRPISARYVAKDSPIISSLPLSE